MKKIFESKGCPKKQTILYLSCGIVSIIGGIFFVLLSNAKHRASAVQAYTPYGKLINSSTIGGGYVLSEDSRKTFMILGFIAIILGILMISNLQVLKKSTFTVYEGYVEGVQYVPLFIVNIKREFHLEYDQVVEVQISQGSFGQVARVVTKGERYDIILAEDGEEGIAYIREKIKMSS